MQQNYSLLNDNHVPSSERPPNSATEFKHLPFIKTLQTLSRPKFKNIKFDEVSYNGIFLLKNNMRNLITNSWNKDTQEYEIKIILRIEQVGLEENVTQRLPYNINIFVNNHPCTLPMLNISRRSGRLPWRCNIPLDITELSHLSYRLPNKLKITWSNEPHIYVAGVFMVQKLTWIKLLEQLNERPVRPSDKTKEMIKKSMTSDSDLGVDFMLITINDPLSTRRMELPVRGIDCVHLSCFDGIQFLQMNEHKEKWMCPICKKKVKYESIEVDEFFLNIVKSSNLSEDCKNVFLLQNGSWTEKKTGVSSSMSKSNDIETLKNSEVLTITDSDDEDDMPFIKRLKKDSEKVQVPIVKSKDMNLRGSTVTESHNALHKPCSSKSSNNDKKKEKQKPPKVIFVITLD